jgi:polyribonucleotide nucleotidyltransferase
MYSWGIFYKRGIPAGNMDTSMVVVQVYCIVGSITRAREHRNHIFDLMIAAAGTARSDTHIRAVGS